LERKIAPRLIFLSKTESKRSGGERENDGDGERRQVTGFVNVTVPGKSGERVNVTVPGKSGERFAALAKKGRSISSKAN
jgi:hypothetical protein